MFNSLCCLLPVSFPSVSLSYDMLSSGDYQSHSSYGLYNVSLRLSADHTEFVGTDHLKIEPEKKVILICVSNEWFADLIL